jgi:hypothetical protein
MTSPWRASAVPASTTATALARNPATSAIMGDA